MDALVAPERAADFIHDRTARLGGARHLRRDKGGVVVVRDETDLLAVRLVRNRKIPASRIFADRLLRTVADRKDSLGQLLLCEREEEVGLILGRVDAAPQHVAAGRSVVIDARVVTGGDAVGAEAARPL